MTAAVTSWGAVVVASLGTFGLGQPCTGCGATITLGDLTTVGYDHVWVPWPFHAGCAQTAKAT